MPPIRTDGPRPIHTPAVTTPTTVSTPSPATTPTPATGLDAATDAGRTGVDGTVAHNLTNPGTPTSDAVRVGIPGLARLTANLQSMPPQPFSLVAGRYPNAVGLPDVLSRMGNSAQGQAAVKQLLAQFQQQTGVAVPDAMVTAALANPARVLQALQVTPGQLSAGIDGINLRHRASAHTPTEPKFNLPRRADLGKLDKLDITRPEGKLKEVAPGLLQGDIKSDLSDVQARRNIAVAETLSRLAANPSRAEGDRFTAVYAGREYTSLDGFISALRKDGHDVTVTFESRVANFSNLKTRAPDGSVLDVPAPLMVRTGEKDAAGNEAVVPAVHSEVIIQIRKGTDTKGPGVEADVKFYQGVSDTGFFPVGLFQEPAWCGRIRHETLTGDKAQEAVRLSGLLTDVVDRTAEKMDLWNGGYGVTGVCNDSVAVVQQAVTGKATMYPLLMRDETLAPELQRRLSDRNRRDDAGIKQLRAAIDALPSDVTANETSKARAAASLPWDAGKEPFESSVKARDILTAP